MVRAGCEAVGLASVMRPITGAVYEYKEAVPMRKFIASVTIAVVAALGTVSAVAATAAVASHGVQAASAADPGMFYHG